jgi:hypothetical protein
LLDVKEKSKRLELGVVRLAGFRQKGYVGYENPMVEPEHDD